MKRKEDLENENGDIPILCIFLYLDYERVLSVYSVKTNDKKTKNL